MVQSASFYEIFHLSWHTWLLATLLINFIMRKLTDTLEDYRHSIIYCLGRHWRKREQLSECVYDHLMEETDKQANVPFEVRKRAYFATASVCS